MNKIIKYNDYVQINPDERILTLDKQEKVKIIDNILQRSYNGGKGLLITYDLSHSGRKINNRIYSTKGQQRGIESLLDPYPKPILRNHDMHGEPIGRFIGGEWQDLTDHALQHLETEDSYWDVRNAFISDDPEKIYKTLKAHNLLDDKKWPGLGRMRVQANITDEEAIKKFMDGRYLTFSAGSTTNRHVCSICHQDWAKDGMCEHRHGKMYDGEKCVFVTGDFFVLEGSVVNSPADDLSQIISMELRDNEESNKEPDCLHNTDEILLTDSTYNFGDEHALRIRKEERTQDSVEINAQEEETRQEEKEEKEQVMEDKEFDHMLIVPEDKMKQLHSTGKTDVIVVSGKERMKIRLIYRTKENTPGGEDSFEEFVDEAFLDEKMFKVPAGAKGNAKKVLEWKEKHGSEVRGMTPVGWARARQLATKSEIGLSTVRRMAAFNRHRKNAAVAPEFKDTPWKDRGYVAWLGWGGTSGIDWAVKTSAANKDSIYSKVSEEEKALFQTPIGDLEQDASSNYKPSPKGRGAKTPAKPSERIKGSKKNKKGSASSAKNSIKTSERILATLKEKVRSHNEKHGSKPGKKVSLGMLKAVWRRGAGAFSSTHRPGMSRDGWGIARVNAFLKLVRSGSPSNPKYKQDNDLLPAGHPKKSSNKSKDYEMSEELLNTVSEEIVEDLQEEDLEPTPEQQEEHDASFEDDVEVDWQLFDFALEGILGDARLTYEQRKELPDTAFCGPERSFPVPDCAHVTAARRLIGQAKASQATKDKIMACVNKKADRMSCGKSEDYKELQSQFEDLESKYSALEEKFLAVLEKLTKTEDSVEEEVISDSIEEKIENTVENTDTDALNVEEDVVETSDEEVKLDLEQQVENPSEHVVEETLKTSDSKVSGLGSFEQKVVKEYKEILSRDGRDVADYYLNTKAVYLPRGFDPNQY